MKKMLLWEKIYAGMNEIEQELLSQGLTDEARGLLNKKMVSLSDVFLFIQHIGQSTEKSTLKFEVWKNRGKNQMEAAEKLGMSIDGLRATIWYFNSRIENIVGEDTVGRIVNCKSEFELKEIESELKERVNSLIKGYFR